MRQLKPKTKNHFDYVQLISENQYVLATGPAGSSKSYTAVGMACQYLTEGRVDSILITRPMVQSGKDPIGYLKGTLDEKVSPYMIPVIEHLEYFLGVREVVQMRKDNVIRIVPLELSRGMNFQRSFVIGDEFQNADFDQIKMFLTRLCKGSKMVLNGDIKQNDIGINDYSKVISKLRGLEGVGIIEMTKADIMRGPMIGAILKRLEE